MNIYIYIYNIIDNTNLLNAIKIIAREVSVESLQEQGVNNVLSMCQQCVMMVSSICQVSSGLNSVFSLADKNCNIVNFIYDS